MSPLLIILIVFLCSTMLVAGMALSGIALFRFIGKSGATDEIIKGIRNWEENADKDVYDFDDLKDIGDFFDRYFDEDALNRFDEPGFEENKAWDEFESGTIDTEYGKYDSDFAELSFSLPAKWTVVPRSEYNTIYNAESNFIYDFYARDDLNGGYLYVRFFDALKGNVTELSAFDGKVKQLTERDFGKYDVIWAEDSKITFDDNEYDQLACRISDGDTSAYEYSFTREVGGYYMQICLFAYDLKDVGTVIDLID